MATNYVVVTQYPGIDVIGGSQTQDVVFVGINTVPHDTYIEFPVIQSVYSAGIVKAAAIGWAQIIEAVWDEDWVVGVQWTQVVNASNQLVSSVIITVTSSSGNSTAQLTVPISQLGPQLHQPQITALHGQLDDAEAA
jgi:hypothetical protein